MSEPVNIRQIAPGTKIALVDGALAEVVSNPSDGVWVFARYLSSPGDPSRVGGEEMIFAQDIVEIREYHREARPWRRQAYRVTGRVSST